MKPWEMEPDSFDWIDVDTGYYCVAFRHPILGHWCGYVWIDSTHPACGIDFTVSCELAVHGGVTFCGEERPPNSKRNEQKGWHVGFDCAHYGDYTPFLPTASISDETKYKTLHFVIAECGFLARQLKGCTGEE